MRNPTILVADDEEPNRMFVARVLGAAGWQVVEAAGGEDAVRLALALPLDLVAMDIDMPDLDGWAATAAIRAAGSRGSSVPILAYTTMRLTADACRALGMDGCLPKPSTPEALAAAVARWWPGSAADAGVARLADVFGADEMARLVARFRDQMAAALIALDGGDDTSAHRIAGIAGTLGFAAISDSWSRLAEGDPAARDDARCEARRAIAAIDRRA